MYSFSARRPVLILGVSTWHLVSPFKINNKSNQTIKNSQDFQHINDSDSFIFTSFLLIELKEGGNAFMVATTSDASLKIFCINVTNQQGCYKMFRFLCEQENASINYCFSQLNKISLDPAPACFYCPMHAMGLNIENCSRLRTKASELSSTKQDNLYSM